MTNITNAAPLVAGQSACTGADPTGFFNGVLDEIELFDRALTPAEIQAIHAAGSGGKAKTYAFNGFFSPIDNVPVVTSARAGQAIPIKWRLTIAGAPLSNPASFVGVTSTGGTCAGGTAPDDIETYVGGSGLQYLGDGSTHTAAFQFK